jgi:hypothetical protein
MRALSFGFIAQRADESLRTGGKRDSPDFPDGRRTGGYNPEWRSYLSANGCWDGMPLTPRVLTDN